MVIVQEEEEEEVVVVVVVGGGGDLLDNAASDTRVGAVEVRLGLEGGGGGGGERALNSFSVLGFASSLAFMSATCAFRQPLRYIVK